MRAINTCCECNGEGVPGAPFPWNGRAEVERCDVCQSFSCDLDAGSAVAADLNIAAFLELLPETLEVFDAEAEAHIQIETYGDVEITFAARLVLGLGVMLFANGRELTHDAAIDLCDSLRINKGKITP